MSDPNIDIAHLEGRLDVLRAELGAELKAINSKLDDLKAMKAEVNRIKLGLMGLAGLGILSAGTNVPQVTEILKLVLG